jgi:serine/threonine protein kinase
MARTCPTCHARFSNEAQYCPVDGTETKDATGEMTPSDPFLGQRIDGRYLIEKVIGSGGMGVVYEAIHESLKKRMAIKVLRPELSRTTTVVERFMREAQTASSIGHANIAAVTDFGYLPGGAPYFVMEFLEGRSLAERLDLGPLSIDETLEFSDQIAAALTAAHDHEIVHRDLKPDNVFLAGREGERPIVKLLDFGIAKAGGELSRITQTGTLFGTPHYMSPEQAAGQTVDRRTDVYSFGVMIYEMLTGDVPFDADTFLGVLAKHMFESPEPIAANDARLGPLEAPLLRALAKRPDERTPDAKTLAAELREAAKGISSADRSAITLSDVPSPRPKTPLKVGPQSRPPPPKNAQALALGVILFGAIAVLAFFGFKAIGSRREPSVVVLPSSPVEAREPPPARATQMVSINTEPEGALVTVEGAVVGHTPLEIPRPSRRVEATLDLAGYEQQRIALSELVAARVSFRMSPARAAPQATSMRPVAVTRTPPSTSAMETASTSTSTPEPPVMRPSMTELVDPWR